MTKDQAADERLSGESFTLSVMAPVLMSIAMTPANAYIVKGATQQHTATETYSDASLQSLTSSVTWSSSSTAVATFSSNGLVTGGRNRQHHDSGRVRSGDRLGRPDRHSGGFQPCWLLDLR